MRKKSAAKKRAEMELYYAEHPEAMAEDEKNMVFAKTIPIDKAEPAIMDHPKLKSGGTNRLPHYNNASAARQIM